MKGGIDVNRNASETYDLLSEGWVRVIKVNGDVELLSLVEVFQQLDQIRSLAGDLGMQDFALLRLLLAICYVTVEDLASEVDPIALWGELWAHSDEFGEMVIRYLHEWSHCFDLLDAERPFMQAAGLTTGNDQIFPLQRLVPDVPNDVDKPYFATRSGRGIESLTLAEAARWLVTAQASDPSGIKTGVVDDPRTTGGKGYPIGVAPAAAIGGLALVGETLRETLLLNLVLTRPQRGADLPGAIAGPVWEREFPLKAGITPTADGATAMPTDTAALYTWPSRRMRLQVSDGRVVGCLIANGDPLDLAAQDEIEHMTAWRQPLSDLKTKAAPLLRPRQHDVERALWRGLEGVLPTVKGGETDRAGRLLKTAGIITWSQELQENGVLDKDTVVTVHAYGLKLDSNNAIIQDVYDDTLSLPVGLFDVKSEQVILAVVNAARNTESAVFALGRLAQRIADASGNRDSEVRSRAVAAGFFAVDPEFRDMLAGVAATSEYEDVLRPWHEQGREILLRLGRTFLDSAPPSSITGRQTNIEFMSAPLAEQRFLRDLDDAFSLSAAATERRMRREAAIAAKKTTGAKVRTSQRTTEVNA